MSKLDSFRLACCLLLVTAAASASPVFGGLRDNNLIEFSYGSYGNRSVEAWLWPPFVKIFQDGKVIHYDDSDNKFYVGRLDMHALESVKRRLSREKYLSTSRFIDMDGDFVNVHGGISYIRYLDGDNEILLATEVRPRTGRVLLTEVIRSYIPDGKDPYYPPSIRVQTSEDKSDYGELNPPVWPFPGKMQLRLKPKVISDAEIIRYLFQRLGGIFSFFVWDFKDRGKRYSIFLNEASGWFEQHISTRQSRSFEKAGIA